MQKNKSFTIQNMVIVALLVAMSIILSRFSLMIPFFGYPSVRFSVTSIPIFLASALFGPVLGACAGFMSDLISFALSTAGGPYYPGFTLNAVIAGAIPGWVVIHLKQSSKTYSFNRLNLLLGILTFSGAILYTNFIGLDSLDVTPLFLSLPINLWMTFFLVGLLITLVIIFRWIQKKSPSHLSCFSIDKLIFINALQYICVNLMLTPLWLNHLYGLPISASIFIRLFKAVVDVPLQVFLIYSVIHVLPKTILGGTPCKTNP